MPTTSRADVREEGGTESLAAPEVENPTALDEGLRPQVPVVVLVDDLDVGRPRAEPRLT